MDKGAETVWESQLAKWPPLSVKSCPLGQRPARGWQSQAASKSGLHFCFVCHKSMQKLELDRPQI